MEYPPNQKNDLLVFPKRNAQLQLLDFQFIDQRSNVVFIGPKAIDAGYKVMFTTALALIESLEMAELKGELKKKLPPSVDSI